MFFSTIIVIIIIIEQIRTFGVFFLIKFDG